MADSERKLKWMPIVLGLSLAINLAVVAAVSGAALRHHGGGKSGPRMGGGGEPIYMRALPEESRRALRMDMREARRGTRPDPATMINVLRHEPFDAEAAAGVLKAERETGVARMEAASAVLIRDLTDMTSQERAAYADRLEELLEKRKARWKERKNKKR